MVTGEVGAGKTTLLRTLIRNLGDNVTLSQVTNTRVSYRELLELILEDFGLNPRGLSKTALLSTLNDFLLERYREGRNCILIVDEAQNLGLRTLEGLRLLSNLETEKAKLLHTILTGQPGLKDIIDSPELEQLRQRITVRYHLGPLSVQEVGEYIRHRVTKVVTDSEKAPVFPEEAVPKIHEATGGIPRLINLLCDEALLHGYVEEKRVIDEQIIGEVAEQVARDQRGRGAEPELVQPQPDPAIDQRFAQIEARLDAVLTDVRQTSTAAAVSPDHQQKVKGLIRKAHELKTRQVEIEQRMAEVAKREAEFNRRLSRVKGEWQRRMRQLEALRRESFRGEVRFPPLKVFVCEPDPLIQGWLADLLDGARIATELYSDYEAFAEAVKDCSAGGWFAVAVLGAEADDAENWTRVSSLSADLAHVPMVLVASNDLPAVRRRMFSTGAGYLVEKPNGDDSCLTTHNEAMEHFKSDVLGAVQALQRQYEAFFSTFVKDYAEKHNGCQPPALGA
jgi:type II secretory pathway predicted ATPase ExeA